MDCCFGCGALFCLRHWPCFPRSPWCCGCDKENGSRAGEAPDILLFGDSSLDFFSNARRCFCVAAPCQSVPDAYVAFSEGVAPLSVKTMAQAGAPLYELCLCSHFFLRRKGAMPKRAMVVSMGGNDLMLCPCPGVHPCLLITDRCGDVPLRYLRGVLDQSVRYSRHMPRPPKVIWITDRVIFDGPTCGTYKMFVEQIREEASVVITPKIAALETDDAAAAAAAEDTKNVDWNRTKRRSSEPLRDPPKWLRNFERYVSHRTLRDIGRSFDFDYERLENSASAHPNFIMIDSRPFFKTVEEEAPGVAGLLFENGESSAKLKMIWAAWLAHVISTECEFEDDDMSPRHNMRNRNNNNKKREAVAPTELEMTRI